MQNDLLNSEFEMANISVETILSLPVESIELSNKVPILEYIPDSNKVFKGKLSIIFVDMRKSTDLTDEIKSKKMVKVYRSFIRIVIQAIRYSGGYSRQFSGDGIMGVFQDITENENTILSEVQAIRAARYIVTLIDYCLNPLLKRYMELTISCGVGICTGTVMITKVGMRGKESDDTADNELGITWVGPTTNYASRFCSLAQSGEIFIDEATFRPIVESTDMWEKTTRVKADRAYKGYFSSDYYLVLDEEIKVQPIKGEERTDDSKSFIQKIFQETQQNALILVGEISKTSIDLGKKLQEITKKEEVLRGKEKILIEKERTIRQIETQLESKKVSLNDWKSRLQKEEYVIHIDIIKKAHCKKDFTIAMGKEFWESELACAILKGKFIGKSETEVKSEVCYALVSIYENLELWNEAYWALCIQAEYHAWIHAFAIENVVKKAGIGANLKAIIEIRLKLALLPEIRVDLQQSLERLQRMGY